MADTNILLWMMSSHPRLSQNHLNVLRSPANEIYFSATSIFEIAVKQQIGKFDFNVDAAEIRAALIERGYRELPVTGAHAVRVLDLPLIHRDPFDRLLIAQALSEDLVLMTADHVVADYPVQHLRV
ncbi:type II toxin-antitoxin system VapC family toxin [Rhizobium sp. SG_E_25_P2]|uniref:type II toxin-antitoxin system VapC family toxin n=1 Tax=Rhizobium sp. SG_E_25_P2 TaxID=2879942 RepID=UPI0024755166|nr:type II toxin-antitoxin system VapC family toxin [Rhizobium sp. SG_E_25_P2]